MNKLLKTISLTLLLTVTIISVQAQENSIRHWPDYDVSTWHFGFHIGLNSTTYALNTVNDYQNIALPANSWPNGPYNIQNTKNLYVQNIEPMLVSPGLTVGIAGIMRLNNHFSLRFIPSMSFSKRRMHYNIGIENFNGNLTTKDFTKSIYTTFVEFPLNIKYRIVRHNNIAPYVTGGVNPKIDLATQKRNQDVDANGVTYINNFVTKRFDFAAEAGVGLDIYLKWFKLGIEVKMSEGLMDIVKAPAFIYTAPIDQLRNRAFLLSLSFE